LSQEVRKYLKPEQLNSILPNYINIFEEVNNIRQLAPKFSKFNKKGYEHFPYKNVISILGERGSGKSTVFNTVRRILLKNEECIKEYTNTTVDGDISECLNDNDINLLKLRI
jgi:ABC-type lipoprotein export system ATPase subunit